MSELYSIRLDNFYLRGFTETASPTWTLDLSDAVWMDKIRADLVVSALSILENLETLCVERV
jgi:hypothetical protein